MGPVPECPEQYEFLREETVDGVSRRYYRERESGVKFDMPTPAWNKKLGRMPTEAEVCRRVDQSYEKAVDQMEAEELGYASRKAYLDAKKAARRFGFIDVHRGDSGRLTVRVDVRAYKDAKAQYESAGFRGEDCDFKLTLHNMEDEEKNRLEEQRREDQKRTATLQARIQRYVESYAKSTATMRAIEDHARAKAAQAEREVSNAMEACSVMMLSVVVPPGVEPGGHFQIQMANRDRFQVTLPPGAAAGQQLQVALPGVNYSPEPEAPCSAPAEPLKITSQPEPVSAEPELLLSCRRTAHRELKARNAGLEANVAWLTKLNTEAKAQLREEIKLRTEAEAKVEAIMQSIEEAEAKAEAQIKALQQTIVKLTVKNEEWKKWAAIVRNGRNFTFQIKSF